jgi:DNA-binding LacI/PurR family transcriptional regulator
MPAGGLTKEKSFGRAHSSGPLLSFVHEAVPFVEKRPDSRAVRAFHGGRAGAVCDQAAVLRQPAVTRPTAIFVSNDYYAVGVYDAARSLGLEIGRDLSVVGFADVPLASLLFPKLTTVNQDAIQIGRNAAELLLDRIEGRVEVLQPRAARVECELVVRSSTGPAPA